VSEHLQPVLAGSPSVSGRNRTACGIHELIGPPHGELAGKAASESKKGTCFTKVVTD